MDIIERVLNILLTICIFFVGVLFAFVLPLGILASDFKLFSMEIGIFRFSGVFLIILGIFSTLFGCRSFIFSKTGTPFLLDTPEELMVGGLYRFVRNPMYCGYCLILFGESLLYESSEVLLYSFVFFILFNLLVILVEEPLLRKKFGKQYELYCKEVPRWIPLFKAFRGSNSKSS
jgi:protein-S-isoprenylcysteine O-methyltransferase Ste14